MSTVSTSLYERELSDFRVVYSKAGCITSIFLVMAGVGLDYFSYPPRLHEFFLMRLLVSGLTGAVLVSLYTTFGRANVRGLTMMWLLLPQAMIACMIYQTDGVHSIYFVGLHLALYAVGIILPITIFEGIAFGLATLVFYVMACVLHPSGIGDGTKLYTSTLFVLFSAAASAVCTWFNEQARVLLFSLQHEVSKKNESLIQTNKALADIKGQLLQREKMAAIGTLSAGLLHELNNPVNYSMMAINLALTLPASKSDELLEESLVDARDGMVRVQNIVSDLKTFAYQKAGDNSQRVFLLENAVRSALRLAGHELKGITVVVDMPQDTHVRGDEPAMIGVLINLLSNAAHAVHAAKREQPQITVRGTMLEEGGIERLFTSVRDNGQGIDPVNISRVFEPFFTTRDVGAGLGLGLSMSYSIVQRHGGTLAVTSELGAWTEFTFDLPRP
jgi:two-component system, sensor histidine kinase PhcS